MHRSRHYVWVPSLRPRKFSCGRRDSRGHCSYQRTRLYTRIALGKARAMDVVSGESSGNFGQLVLLYPLLFWLQALQANIGVSMMLRGYGALFSPEGWLVGCYLRSCYPYVTCAPVMPER